jgi:hypothetical protein
VAQGLAPLFLKTVHIRSSVGRGIHLSGPSGSSRTYAVVIPWSDYDNYSIY